MDDDGDKFDAAAVTSCGDGDMALALGGICHEIDKFLVGKIDTKTLVDSQSELIWDSIKLENILYFFLLLSKYLKRFCERTLKNICVFVNA